MKNFLSWMLIVSLFAVVGCSDKPEPEGRTKPPPPPPPPPVEEKLNVSIENLTFESVSIKIAPTDETMTYYVSLIEKSEFDRLGSDAQFVDFEVEVMKEFAESNGVPFDEFLDAVLFAGEHIESEPYQAALDANTEFYAYAYGLDTKGKVTMPMEKVAFKTPEAPPVQIIDCDFEFDMQTLRDTQYAFVVYPSNDKVLVWIDTVLQATYDRLGGTPEALGAHIAELFAKDADVSGLTLATFVRAVLKPGAQGFMEYMGAFSDTGYVAFAMGFDSQGRVCTEVAIHPFRTLPREVSGAAVEVEFNEYYDGAALFAYDSKRYAKFKEKAYLPCYLTPGTEAEEWAVMWVPNSFAEFPDDGLGPIIKDNGARNMKAVAIGCQWGEGTIVSVAWDHIGVLGEIRRYPVTLTQEGVSPIEDLVGGNKAPLYEVPMVLTPEAAKTYLVKPFPHLQQINEQRQPISDLRLHVSKWQVE